jgi:hypothetical protein
VLSSGSSAVGLLTVSMVVVAFACLRKRADSARTRARTWGKEGVSERHFSSVETYTSIEGHTASETTYGLGSGVRRRLGSSLSFALAAQHAKKHTNDRMDSSSPPPSSGRARRKEIRSLLDEEETLGFPSAESRVSNESRWVRM